MNTLTGEILTLPKMSGSVSTPKSLSGNVGAKTINIGGKGDDGATFIPSVSADGIISWTNDKDLLNPEPVNIKGVKGDKGDKGDRGTQGVQGIQGERGEQGIQGVQGEKGEKGDPGAPGKDGADGQPGQPGKDGINGKDGTNGVNGKDGADGKNGIDGISPIVSVEDITGGHRVTITDKEGAKTFDVMNGKDGQGGGGGAAIIDVTELPTDNVDENVFYRLLSGVFYYNGTPQADWTAYIVESLPVEGVWVTTDMVHVSLYYAVDTGSVSGYISSALSGMVGVPAGWYPVEALAQAFGLGWGGIIWSEHEDPADGANRLVLSYAVYQYKRKWVNITEKVGWRGSSAGSEVFNSLVNTASGESSHAEGYQTTASGNCSHAEGLQTTASGLASHAEGSDTTASGNCSHAEGNWTTAGGKSQHVQGEFNIEDLSADRNIRAKYAHIVGNGTSDSDRSNAHTLDWDGNAWYAGAVEGTAMIIKSPNGTRFKITVEDDGTIKSTKI